MKMYNFTAIGMVFFTVGFLYMCYWFFKCLKFVWQLLKTTFLGRNIDFTRFGEWAVVTGCTDGIGKSYAKQLAAKGMNIILISRNEEKLDDVASEIDKSYKVKTMIIQVDFFGGHDIYESIGKQLNRFDIGVLVNNVAVGAIPGYLHELPTEVMWKQINANLMSTFMLTRLVIPGMVERKRGVVINLSSVTSLPPVPLLGAYPATKAGMVKFSESLDIEYSSKGIIVQCVMPCFVATKMTGMKPTLFTPTPDDYVRCVLKKVGVTFKCHGYWPHELQTFLFMRLLPRWLVEKLIANAMMEMRNTHLLKLGNEKKIS